MKLKKQYNTPDYQAAFSRPPYLSSKAFLIWVSTNGTGRAARLGVVISKKNVKMAVVRNRYKRIAKELFRPYKSKLINKDIILVIKSVGSTKSKQDWKQKLIRAYTWLAYFVGK